MVRRRSFLTTYLRVVTALNEREELEAILAIEAGREAERQLRASGSIDRETRVSLKRTIEAGRIAHERLTDANLVLIERVIAKFEHSGESRVDLRTEGLIGLNRAIEKFDRSRGVRFATYAWYWVYQGVSRGASAIDGVIKFPVEVQEQLHSLKQAAQRLRRNGVEKVDVQSLSDASGIPTDDVRELLELARIRKVESIDNPNVRFQVEHFAVDEAEPPGERQQSLVEIVGRLLEEFSERDRFVLELRLGAQDGQPRTLDEAAVAAGITRERVRQIEQKFLARLRHPDRLAEIRALLDD